MADHMYTAMQPRLLRHICTDDVHVTKPDWTDGAGFQVHIMAMHMWWELLLTGSMEDLFSHLIPMQMSQPEYRMPKQIFAVLLPNHTRCAF